MFLLFTNIFVLLFMVILYKVETKKLTKEEKKEYNKMFYMYNLRYAPLILFMFNGYYLVNNYSVLNAIIFSFICIYFVIGLILAFKLDKKQKVTNP